MLHKELKPPKPPGYYQLESFVPKACKHRNRDSKELSRYVQTVAIKSQL